MVVEPGDPAALAAAVDACSPTTTDAPGRGPTRGRSPRPTWTATNLLKTAVERLHNVATNVGLV